MIFLSAQPDDIYFIWQLEILIRNLNKLGVSKKDIHIVIGFHPLTGLKQEFEQFIKINQSLACFFLYPDTRPLHRYVSTIRPHLLSKHWEHFPDLYNETIFYHDSDIILSRIPHIETGDINYVSDTRSYLNADYILKCTDKDIFKAMCAIVGIPEAKVLENNFNTGGAQYVLKKITVTFWEKVYRDSEALFCLLDDFNNNEQQKLINQPEYTPKKIQAWCADMWAVLWNLWHFNKAVQVHPELAFCWPTDPIHLYQEKAILHYSGDHTEKELFFYKRDYIQYAPWYDSNLLTIPATNCSYPLVQLILARKLELDQKRLRLNDFLFVIEGTGENKFHLIRKYILKYLDTEVIDATDLPYYHHEKVVIRIPGPILIPVTSIMKIVNIPYAAYRFSQYYRIDQLFDAVFTKVLDSDVLIQNMGKFSIYHDPTVILKTQNSATTEVQPIIQLEDPIFLLA